MTTLTNFLESSFIQQQQQSTTTKNNSNNQTTQISLQNPIWVLNIPSSTNLQHKFITDYAINHNIQYLKQRFYYFCRPTIHLDLGISLLKKWPLSSCENSIVLENNDLKLRQPNKDKPYFIVNTPIMERVQKGFLSALIQKINTIKDSKRICFVYDLILELKDLLIGQCKVPQKYQNCFTLIVEGIEAMLPLGFTNQVESFISQLSNLHSSIKQVSIVSMQALINKELQFSLERISTCLTTLISHNQVQNSWECSSTVRRYTGYSNEETYVISYSKVAKKIKVSKKIVKLNIGQETQQQKQMVGSLGFAVKKDDEEKRKQAELRSMIYPHLNKRKDCNCQGSQCKGCGCAGQYNGTGQNDEDLFILDQEQQDQDDVDV